MSYHGYRRETIHLRAADLLRSYRQKHPDRFRLPMDPFDIADFCGLGVIVEPMEDELPGFRPLAKIIPSKKLIVVDEQNYNENRGQAHFSIGHELGHWELYLKKELTDGHIALLEMNDDEAAAAGFYRTRHGLGRPSAPNLHTLSESGRQILVDLFKGIDTPLVESAVNTFSAAVLMPAELVREYAEQHGHAETTDETIRPFVKACAETCGVSQQAMGIRFEELGLAYCRTENGYTSYSRSNPRDLIQPPLL